MLTFSTANLMLESMNETIDPCEHFFNYACSNWSKKHPRPDGYESFNHLSELQNPIDDLIYG